MLPIDLPISPMLAKSTPNIPLGEYAYEPKWDGFRCILARDEAQTWLYSRSKKPLNRYFPELVEVAASLPVGCVLDGEIVVRAGEPGAQHLSWDDLSNRIHPAASRIQLLSEKTPAEVVAFDILAHGGDDLTSLGYRERRAALAALFSGGTPHPSIHLTAMTKDPALAQEWFIEFEGAGLDGVVAKPLSGTYQRGKRTMLKVKHKRTAEAVVIGYRRTTDGTGVGSLLLGMFDADGELVKMGGIGAFSDKMRVELLAALSPLTIRGADDEPVVLDAPHSRYGRPGNPAVVTVSPELVVEVAFDQLEGQRFRHAVTFLRWRPDRTPESCLLTQVNRPLAYDLAEVLLG